MLNSNKEEILLWENPNPNAAFSKQNITLATSDYREYCIFCASDTKVLFLKYEKSIKGKGAMFNMVSLISASLSATLIRRQFAYVNETTLNVQDCNLFIQGKEASVDNIYLVPLKIIGYKAND